MESKGILISTQVGPSRLFRPKALPQQLVPWVLWLSDVVALELSLFLAMAVRVFLSYWWPFSLSLETYATVALAMLVMPLGYAVWSLYPGYGTHPVERMRRTLLITAALFLCVFSWSFLDKDSGLSRGILLIAGCFAMVLVPTLGAVARELLHRWGWWGVQVVILGANATGTALASSLQRERYLGLIPVAFLDPDPKKRGQMLHGIPVAGGFERAAEFSKLGIHEALVAMPNLSREQLNLLIQRLPFLNVVVVPDLEHESIPWSLVRELGMIHGLAVRKNLLLPRNRRVKHSMDRLLGWPLFILSLPIVALAALWVRAVSPGSPFFAQVREGLGGRPIKVWKLRTMYPDADVRLQKYLSENPEAKTEWERSFKLRHDPRILPGVGQLLRKSSLDELPQLFNVVRGDMSLVGPRPFPAYHLEKFSDDFRALRHSVLPGLTGFWQVWARSDSDLKLQEDLDTYYIRNWSPWLDIYLLARTVVTVLLGRGAY